LINWFRSQFTCGWSKQGQHFAGVATNVLMILACRSSLRVKGVAGMGNGLIGTGFILTPQGQTQALCQQIGSLYDRFFSCV
jgi:hypothetical protein